MRLPFFGKKENVLKQAAYAQPAKNNIKFSLSADTDFAIKRGIISFSATWNELGKGENVLTVNFASGLGWFPPIDIDFSKFENKIYDWRVAIYTSGEVKVDDVIMRVITNSILEINNKSQYNLFLYRYGNNNILLAAGEKKQIPVGDIAIGLVVNIGNKQCVFQYGELYYPVEVHK